MEIRRGLSARRSLAARRGLRRRGGTAPAAGLAALIAVGGVAGFWVARRGTARDGSQNVAVVAAAEADAVSSHLEADARLLGAVSGAIGGNPDRPLSEQQAVLARVAGGLPSGQVVAIAQGAAPGAVTVTEMTPPAPSPALPTNLAGQADWQLILQVARDDGDVEVSAGATAGGGFAVRQALPLYGTPTVPVDVGDRRQTLAGYVVSVEPFSQLAAGAGTGPHLNVRIVQGTTVLHAIAGTDRGSAPGSAASQPITAGGVSWAVQAWSTRPAPALPWVILGGSLSLAVAAGLVAAAGSRAAARREEAAAARADELELVARTGPLLQQSLELGDLLPTFVVEISDEFGLEAMAVNLASESGQLVRAFSVGTGNAPLTTEPADLPALPRFVLPGQTITVPLVRADRLIGALSARAQTGLTGSQVETLRAVCDLLASALGNVRLYQEEQDMVARLRDLDRLKTTFLGSVSHELRTTVTAIEGFAGLLATQSNKLDEARRSDFIERIRRNSRSLGVLVEDLLDFARLEQRGLSVGFQPVDLTDLVPKVIEQMSSILDQRPVSTDLEKGVVARADPAAIERILVNLLSNAAKYTPAGTQVSVSVGRDDGSAILVVADRGPGIPPAERERIFDLFYRVDNEVARATRGVGIGLALVRQLVDLLHGTIVADETPGGGARFRISVPLAEDGTHPPEPQLTKQAGPTRGGRDVQPT